MFVYGVHGNADNSETESEEVDEFEDDPETLLVVTSFLSCLWRWFYLLVVGFAIAWNQLLTPTTDVA